MEFGFRSKPKKPLAGSLAELYPHDLQFYTLPPNFQISLKEFEDLAFERLQVLRILEQASQKGPRTLSPEWKTMVLEDLNRAKLKRYARLIEAQGTNHSSADLQARRADHISHFILRLAYSRTDELRRWFLNRELELFKLRFMSLSSEGLKCFLSINNLNYTPISREEKFEIIDKLRTSTLVIMQVKIENTDFYKVPFAEVSDVVRNRKVFLSRGSAYIPCSELIICIASLFRSQLNEALTYTFRKLPLLDDERLDTLLSTLHTTYTGVDYSTRKDPNGIGLEELDAVSRQSFPLCMRQLHESIRSTHHLKYQGRMQYGLFLKGIGLSLEDAITFWREEFTKKMDGEKFNKQYLYNIKHNYGQAGSRVNYSPYGCLKIITSSVGPGECHGCPFKHWDGHVLKQKLIEYGIGSEGVQEICELVAKHHYQIACGKYFEHIHGVSSKNTINHPNQYFEESRDVLANRGNKNTPKPATKSSKPKPQEESFWEEMDVSQLDDF